MEVLASLMITLLLNILGFTLPALLAAWLLTLALPVTFSQVVWLSLGMIIAMEYIIQNVTDMPGQTGVELIQRAIAVVIAYILLAISSGLGWLLLQILSIDLTVFETTMLFAISLAAGFFFLSRSGSVGLPRWMMLSDIDLEDEYDEDYIVSPPKRPARRRSRSRKRSPS